MDNYNKYLKYKNKYVSLKNKTYQQQRGGANIFPINDEIHFWSRQLMEHSLFLHLGLEELNLKKEALESQMKWKHFLNANFYDKGVRVNLDTIILTPADLAKVDDIDIDKFNRDYLEPMIEFNTKVVNILKTGKWVGWIFPALAEHMLKEANYFNRKVNGPAYTLDEEIEFDNTHNAEEIGTSANLIDPNPEQQKTIDLVRSYALKAMSKFRAGQALSMDGPMDPSEPFPQDWTKEQEDYLKGLNNTDKKMLLELSIRYGKELTDFANDTNQKIEANQLKSVINPILGKHVYREFARFTETLKALQA